MFTEKEDLDKDFDELFENYVKDIKNLRQENMDLKQEIATLQRLFKNILIFLVYFLIVNRDLLNEQNLKKEKKNSDFEAGEQELVAKEKSRCIKLIKLSADLIINNFQVNLIFIKSLSKNLKF